MLYGVLGDDLFLKTFKPFSFDTLSTIWFECDNVDNYHDYSYLLSNYKVKC